MRITTILIIISLALLVSCNSNSNEKRNDTNTTNQNDSIAVKNNTNETSRQEITIEDTSFAYIVQTTIKKIANKNFTEINAEEIIFSPYPYLSEKSVKLNTEEISKLLNSDSVLFWGKYAGSGEDINLSFNDYYNKFVFDKKYDSIPPVLLNVENRGTYQNNIKEFIPGSFIAEFYSEGTEKYSNMDWTSLYLVFAKNKDKYTLKAIVHNSWTP